jgi:hypothetical protein
MWGCASVEYCQARGEMLSGSKTYIYAPWLAEQDCGFVFSHAKQIAIEKLRSLGCKFNSVDSYDFFT